MKILSLLITGVVMLAGCGDKPESKPQADNQALIVTSQSAAKDPLGPRYEATLAEGIDFRKPGHPNFVEAVNGVSGHEEWGAWSDGSWVTIKFSEILPKAFTLRLHGGAWGENLNKPIKFHVGSVQKEYVFKGDPFSGPSTAVLAFSLSDPADTLRIEVPFPTVGNGRAIGVGLITLKIEPASTP